MFRSPATSKEEVFETYTVLGFFQYHLFPSIPTIMLLCLLQTPHSKCYQMVHRPVGVTHKKQLLDFLLAELPGDYGYMYLKLHFHLQSREQFMTVTYMHSVYTNKHTSACRPCEPESPPPPCTVGGILLWPTGRCLLSIVGHHGLNLVC